MKAVINVLSCITFCIMIITICIATIKNLEPIDERSIVPIYELQLYLQEQGHELEADGKLGPETQKAWEEQVWKQENKEFNR